MFGQKEQAKSSDYRHLQLFYTLFGYFCSCIVFLDSHNDLRIVNRGGIKDS